MRVLNKNILPEHVAQINQNEKINSGNSQVAFQDVLSNTIAERLPLQFSKHAHMRLNSRDITLSTEQMQRVEAGISQARQKGIQDSLVFVDNVALVVNVKSKTVITAMNQANQNIFTNIDGAVVV